MVTSVEEIGVPNWETTTVSEIPDPLIMIVPERDSGSVFSLVAVAIMLALSDPLTGETSNQGSFSETIQSIFEEIPKLF